MIHVNSVTAALYTLLSSDAALTAAGFTVCEGEPLNKDGRLTPWVGVYEGGLEVNPHTLGGTQPWQAKLELLVYVQAASRQSGQEATRQLAQHQQVVLDVLNRHRTLGGTVLTLGRLAVQPYQRDLDRDTWFFTNEISIAAELRG
ncbi:MAG: hypothetical protein OEV94_01815 [Deltaproteobacteria bacterium]|nr:hypothetical protein [Deltaproteobacteria bacterium]